jgi:hypothetical protein
MKKKKVINIEKKRADYNKISDIIGAAVSDQGWEYEKRSPKKIILKPEPNSTLELSIKVESLEQYIKKMKKHLR